MFCPNCGTKNEEEALFCGNCGTRLVIDVPQEEPAQPEVTPVQESAPVEPEVTSVQENVPVQPQQAFGQQPVNKKSAKQYVKAVAECEWNDAYSLINLPDPW